VRRSSSLLIAALLVALALPVRADDRLADLVEQVAPSVVNIHTSGTRQPQTAWDALFGGPQHFNSLGSGFVVDGPRGLIITNAHVIQQASTIQVLAWDGRIVEAVLLGADRDMDLAVLEAPSLNLPAVRVGDSRALRVGEDVFAVGNPYGHGHTVTTGILSARARALGRAAFDLFLQTDAAINPGNSGGPLFDGEGRVIGVNTIIDSRAEAIGFAMPVELALGALPFLAAGKTVEAGWSGVQLRVAEDGALLVSRVFEDGPAWRGGLRVGDRVTEVMGRKVTGRATWAEWFELGFPGETRRVRVSRDHGRIDMEVSLRLEARDDWARRNAGDPIGVPALRVTLQGLLPDVADEVGVRAGQLVVRAEPGSWFRVGDIIEAINGSPILTAEDAAIAAEDALRRRVLQATVIRNGSRTRIASRW